MLQRIVSRPISSLICRSKYGISTIGIEVNGRTNYFADSQPCVVRSGVGVGDFGGVGRRSVILTTYRRLLINRKSKSNNASNNLRSNLRPAMICVNLGQNVSFATTTSSSASSSSSSSAGSNDTSSAAIRDRLLQSSYLHVPNLGFSEKALTSGANDIGLSPLSIGMLGNV